MTISRIFLVSISFLFAGILFTSCEKDKGDTEKPVIDLISPADGDTLWVGHDVHFDAEFSDNIELSSYKIDIHPNFDGHTHKSAFHDDDDHTDHTDHDHKGWHHQQSWDFEEDKRNVHIHQHQVVVPEEVDGHPIATGEYHFMVYCTDKAGNESWVAVKVIIHPGHSDPDHDSH